MITGGYGSIASFEQNAYLLNTVEILDFWINRILLAGFVVIIAEDGCFFV